VTPEKPRLQIVQELLEKLRACPCGMCSDCIEILCEEIIPRVDEEVSLRGRVAETRRQEAAGQG
jgi:hypothetical protein